MSATTEPVAVRPIVVVSRCLGFDHCRYNGQTIPDAYVDRLKPHVQFITVCPEVAIGLGVPRDPIRIVRQDGERRLMQPATGRDITDTMQAYVETWLDELGPVDGFLLKGRSPSCGLSDVKVHQGLENGPSVGRGHGFFGRAVVDRFPEAAIESEGRLKNYRLREHYYIKLFALARLRGAIAAESIAALTQFHAQSKYLLMAYHQTRLREMGRLLANRDGLPLPEIAARYRALFAAALARPASCRAHINALMHTAGYFKNQLTPQEKAFFGERLESYRAGQTTLATLRDLMRAWIVRFGDEYLAQQSYFAPYPVALVDTSDSGGEHACLDDAQGRSA